MIRYEKQAAKVKAPDQVDEVGDHFSLLDGLRSLLYNPELYNPGPI
jgi:hypothetical protein